MEMWLENLPDWLMSFPVIFATFSIIATALLLTLKHRWSAAWFLVLFILGLSFATVHLVDYHEGEKPENAFYISFSVSVVWLFFAPWLIRLWKKHYPDSFFRQAVTIGIQTTGLVLLAAGFGSFTAYNLDEIVIAALCILVSIVIAALIIGLSKVLLLLFGCLANLEKRFRS